MFPTRVNGKNSQSLHISRNSTRIKDNENSVVVLNPHLDSVLVTTKVCTVVTLAIC